MRTPLKYDADYYIFSWSSMVKIGLCLDYLFRQHWRNCGADVTISYWYEEMLFGGLNHIGDPFFVKRCEQLS